MRLFCQKSFLFFFTLSLLFSSFLAMSAPDKEIAKVLVAEGIVYALHEESRRELSRGSSLFEDDWLVVGEGSRAEILESDGTNLSFLEKSKFHFVKLNADAAHPETYENIAHLATGGLKVISGGLAKLRPEGYSLQTPIATIGIRGTEFIVALVMRENVLNADIALTSGHISVTQRNAVFLSDKKASPTSNELITLLSPGDAIRSTPHTVKHIKRSEVYGYDLLQKMKTGQQSDQKTFLPPPISGAPPGSHPSDSPQNPNAPSSPLSPSTGTQGIIKPSSDSEFCNPS